MNIPLIVLGCAVVMVAVEFAQPGRHFPKRKLWIARAALLNGAQASIAYVAAISWEPGLAALDLAPASCLRVATLPLTAQVLIGYLGITLVYYWWHRARHQVPFLWRWLHQIHHSPSRLEVVTSFYKHPVEIFTNSILSSFILAVLFDLSAPAIAITVLVTGIAELFYHWNVRTPYWLGFLIQRPESHCVHHEKNHHRNNYSDLPIWDMLFGTFENPKRDQFICGYEGEREYALGSMLMGKSVDRHNA